MRNIKYYLNGGTAVGALRNKPGGQIKWDDDLDFIIHENDKGIIVKDCVQDWFPFEIPKFAKQYWQFKLKNSLRRKSMKTYYLDIFFMRPGKDNTTVLITVDSEHPKEYPIAEFHKSCIPCTFWGRDAICPVRHIDEFYPEWRDTIRLWSHSWSSKYEYKTDDPAIKQLLLPFTNDHIIKGMKREQRIDDEKESGVRTLYSNN